MTAAIRRQWKMDRKPFWILYGYAVLVYLPLLVLRLTNDIDGLWNQDDYMAGTWELSIGRWLWPWLDRARFGVSLDPQPGVLSLAVYVISFLLILRILGYRADTPVSILSGFLFLASTAITCQMSHGYMVITFAVSFFLAVLAVWLISRSIDSGTKWNRCLPDILLAGVVIALMMGCYQAGIGTTCLVALLYFMRIVERRDAASASRAISFALRMLAGIAVGAVLYEILLHIHLDIFHVELSSYQGFSEIGPAYFIGHLGKGVQHAYEEMRYVLFTGVFRFSRLQTHRWFWLVYLIPFASSVSSLVRILRNGGQSSRTLHERRNAAVCFILYLVSLLLIPLFAGSFYLLAPEAETHMQMLLPYSLVLPLLLCGWNDMQWNDMETKKTPQKPRKTAQAAAWVFLVGSCLLIYGRIFMNLTDQYAMYVGRRATSSLAENILNEAEALGQDPINGLFEIIGVPAKSPLFAVKDAFYQANDYAQYGNWSSDVSFSRVSWKAMYRNYLRTNVTFAEGDTEAAIAALPEIPTMPVFPTPGSIQNLYGVTVIRISE